MKYKIEKLNGRIAELDDKIVEQYLKVEDEIRDNNFFIVIKKKFGHLPTEEELSDKELSDICNEILLSQLELFTLLPKAISYVENNKNLIKENAAKGILTEYSLEDN